MCLIQLRQRVVGMERVADKVVSVEVFDETAGVVRRVTKDEPPPIKER